MSLFISFFLKNFLYDINIISLIFQIRNQLPMVI